LTSPPEGGIGFEEAETVRRTALAFTLVLIVSACSPAAQDTTTTSSSTTTTTIAVTTTTMLEVTGDGGADPQLAALIRALYALPQAGVEVAAPPSVIDSFTADTTSTTPASAVATVGVVGDAGRVAVVAAGDDITLAVADPTWRVVGGWWPSHHVEPVLGEFPKTIAVVGSDARPNEDREATRADSIHFVVLAEDGASAVVGLPRDSWVPIDGGGRRKVNASLNVGGPEGMMRTFTDLTGAEFDGYLLTGFAGFQDMIGVLGGLEIDVPRALQDRHAKASIAAGLQLLGASDALAFSRVRKALPDGDLGRQLNGGLALMAAVGMVQALGPSAIPGLLEQSWDMYSTDIGLEELLTLAAAITLVDLNRTTNVVAAGSPGTAGRASVVFLKDSAYTTFEDMQDGHLEVG
jgi:LCP family protein required for cell wall assembly